MGRQSKARNKRQMIQSKINFRSDIGFMGLRYKEYLNSDWWKSLRLRYLFGKICSGCGLPATELHHVTYANLGNESECDLMPLCSGCHCEVHKRLESANKSVEWTVWALRKMFGWSRRETNKRFGLSFVPGGKSTVMHGKI